MSEKLQISAYDLAERFTGIKEIPGKGKSHQIMSMLRLDNNWPEDDEVPWCSAFVNYIAWLLRLPRSKSLMARSWLGVGEPINLQRARKGPDVVVLWRGSKSGSSGHVGFYAGYDEEYVYMLGGNQSDTVNVAKFPVDRILGVRRLYA